MAPLMIPPPRPLCARPGLPGGLYRLRAPRSACVHASWKLGIEPSPVHASADGRAKAPTSPPSVGPCFLLPRRGEEEEEMARCRRVSFLLGHALCVYCPRLVDLLLFAWRLGMPSRRGRRGRRRPSSRRWLSMLRLLSSARRRLRVGRRLVGRPPWPWSPSRPSPRSTLRRPWGCRCPGNRPARIPRLQRR